MKTNCQSTNNVFYGGHLIKLNLHLIAIILQFNKIPIVYELHDNYKMNNVSEIFGFDYYRPV